MVADIFVARGGALPCIPSFNLKSTKEAVFRALNLLGLDKRHEPRYVDLSETAEGPSFICIADDGKLIRAQAVTCVGNEMPKVGQIIYLVFDLEGEARVAFTSRKDAVEFIDLHASDQIYIQRAKMA